jgi:hypothetical protein
VYSQAAEAIAAEAVAAARVVTVDIKDKSDCHFSVQLNHFVPDFLSYSVAGFLK